MVVVMKLRGYNEIYSTFKEGELISSSILGDRSVLQNHNIADEDTSSRAHYAPIVPQKNRGKPRGRSMRARNGCLVFLGRHIKCEQKEVADAVGKTTESTSMREESRNEVASIVRIAIFLASIRA